MTHRFRLRRLPPHVAALIAQAGGGVAAWALLLFFPSLPPLLIAIGQGFVAAIISSALGSRWWWQLIHLLFFPAVVLTQALDLPPSLYLAAFLVLWLLFRNALVGQVPLYLSNDQAVAAIARQLPTDRPFRFLDLGSGTGALLLPLAKQFPNGTFVGIESAPASRWWAKWRGKGVGNLHYRAGDLFTQSWQGYDYLYAFLSPTPMAKVEAKAKRELTDAILISNSFPRPTLPPFRIEPLDEAERRTLYWYRFPP